MKASGNHIDNMVYAPVLRIFHSIFWFLFLVNVEAIPLQVQGVNVTRGTSGGYPTLTVQWTAVSGTGITYTVRYSKISGTTTEPPSGALNVSGITGTSTTLSGLEQGTSYYIWVAAVSSGGQGPYSIRVSQITYNARDGSPPTNITITRLSQGVGFRVSWTAPILPPGLTITGYSVQYKKQGTPDNSYIAVTVGVATQKDITGLQSGTKYQIRVATVTHLGRGPRSFCCQDNSLPSQVQDVTVERDLSDGLPSLTLSWTEVSETGITYTVWYSASRGTTTEPPSEASYKTGINGTSTTLSGLAQGIRYYIWVATNSSNGQGPYSLRVSQTAFKAGDASVPTNVTASPLSVQAGIRVSWTAPTLAKGLTDTGYAIQYKIQDNPDHAYMNVTVGAGTTQRDITGLKSGTEYRIRVATITELGTGPYCCERIAIFAATIPSQVQGVTVTRNASGGYPTLTVQWTAVSGTRITYTVRYSKRSGTTTEPQSGASTMSGITGTSTTLSGLEQGTSYYIWVAAVSSGEQGPYSIRIIKTTYSVPQKITQVNIKRTITARLPSLSIAWSVPESEPFVHYYQVDYGQNTSGSWKRWSPDPNTTSVTITDLLLGTHYIVRVRAVSEVGIGSWSNEFGNATYDVDFENTSCICSSCEPESTLTIAAGIGGTTIGLLIGAIVAIVITKIIWGAPNTKDCRRLQSTAYKERKNREGNYDTADTEMNNNPAYVANIYDSID